MKKLSKEISEQDEIIWDLFAQACYRNGFYDHAFMSAYENAQEYLIEHEIIKREECKYK